MEKNKRIKQAVTKGTVKVPVIMQLEATECGAASLAMVMAYFEKWLPLEQIRQDCAVSRDGSSARNIMLAARNYGMVVHGYQASVDSLVEEGPFPCIIHWGFNHFVVLNGFQNGKAYINDPARGFVKVPMKEFEDSYTGVMITIEPGESFAPSGRKKTVWKFAAARLQGTGAAIAFVIFTTLIDCLINVIKPGFSRIFLDRLLTGQNASWFEPFILLLALFSALQIIVGWLSAHYSLRITGKLAAVGNTSYIWKVLHLPMQFFGQRISGDIADRQTMNASVANTLVNTLAPLVLNAIMMIFYLVVMMRYSPMLTVIGLLSIVVNLFMSRIISNKRINVTRVQMRDSGKLAGSTVSAIELIETIKASGAEDGYFERWAGFQASVNAQGANYSEINRNLGMIPGLVQSLTNMTVLGLGVWLVIQGQFTIGMIMAFQGYLSSFTKPASAVISAGQSVQEMVTQMERLDDVMTYPNAPVFERKTEGAGEEQTYAKLSGRLEMRNVTFGYSRLAPPLISDFNLTLEPGKKVAFVGASGCGKSTLAKLISGLYEPWSGEILFDGEPIREIDHSVFTGSVAVVDQDISMFEDTLSNNIKMWDTSIEDFEMILAARDAQIHDDIISREGGYQHKLLDGGKDFSGGQRQRMEIARALAQDPTIIIMDEATSALDASTEYNVVKGITDRGITCVVIAHRLSTIRDCDEIVVMRRGKVAERGTHEELYAKNGLYTSLISNE